MAPALKQYKENHVYVFVHALLYIVLLFIASIFLHFSIIFTILRFFTPSSL